MKLRQMNANEIDEMWDKIMSDTTTHINPPEVEKWKQRFIGAVMIHSYGEDIEDIVKAIEEL